MGRIVQAEGDQKFASIKADQPEQLNAAIDEDDDDCDDDEFEDSSDGKEQCSIRQSMLSQDEESSQALNLKLYEDEAAKGNIAAQCSLAVWYELGFVVPKDERRAFELFSSAAEKGSARAQYHLGSCFERGVGCTANLADAFTWLHRSAQQDFGAAQVAVARMYRKGNKAVSRNLVTAAEWYLRAAEGGCAAAQNAVARMYCKGNGVPVSISAALHWYTRAATESGSATAQTCLGCLYIRGEFLPRDLRHGVQLYTRAAAQGHARAQFLLGRLRERGLAEPDFAATSGAGVNADGECPMVILLERDRQEAVRLYEKAALSGHVRAMLALSDCYMRGRGQPYDPVSGFAWLYRAFDRKMRYAAKELYKRSHGMFGESAATERRAGVARSTGWRVAEELRTLASAAATITLRPGAPQVLMVASKVERHLLDKRIILDAALADSPGGCLERAGLVEKLVAHLKIICDGDYESMFDGTFLLFPEAAQCGRVLGRKGGA
eukprot:TRINITY_DN58339_c0_g1_i1.p1 TRINITY_DN58339_c0_g1~~TRINITY_DN58339_c0_g1_i1.p1  ORF type:complete len:558 (+),score=102.70 TRINITY_DN58339_c0_g1_i1:193-1674(+)